ncbi:hypothetical protein EK904_001892, partial [Melospiza melodia maxima]
MMKSSQIPATATEVHRTQAPRDEWYHRLVLPLENHNQTTHILYPDAFTSARWKGLPGTFHSLVLVGAPEPSLSMRQGQQQAGGFTSSRAARPCHHPGKHLGSPKRPMALLVLHPMGSDTDPLLLLLQYVPTSFYCDSPVLNNGAACSLISKSEASVVTGTSADTSLQGNRVGRWSPCHDVQAHSQTQLCKPQGLAPSNQAPELLEEYPTMQDSKALRFSELCLQSCVSARLKISQSKQIICSAFPTSPSLMSDPELSLNLKYKAAPQPEKRAVILSWTLDFSKGHFEL